MGLTSSSQAGLPDSVEAPAWRCKPSTYIVCGRDRALLPAMQRGLAARATYVEEWPTAHSPFLSDPRRVVEMLSKLAADG